MSVSSSIIVPSLVLKENTSSTKAYSKFLCLKGSFTRDIVDETAVSSVRYFFRIIFLLKLLSNLLGLRGDSSLFSIKTLKFSNLCCFSIEFPFL